jgi:hypothetical protein
MISEIIKTGAGWRDMNKDVLNNLKKTGREKACRLFLTRHSGIPSALLGGQMEREAYLDVLLPPVQETGSKPKPGKPIRPSR